jgi:hypothetical protein
MQPGSVIPHVGGEFPAIFFRNLAFLAEAIIVGSLDAIVGVDPGTHASQSIQHNRLVVGTKQLAGEINVAIHQRYVARPLGICRQPVRGKAPAAGRDRKFKLRFAWQASIPVPGWLLHCFR